MNKGLLVVVALLLMVGTLALGYPPAGAEPPVPTLRVIGPWAGAEMEAFMPVLQAAEEALGINIEYIIFRAEDLAPIMPIQFAHGMTPGDVIFMWPWFIREHRQHVLAMTDLIDPAQFVPGVLDAVTVDGQIYGLGYTGKVKPGFWYRRSFFEKHGLTAPADWCEFRALLAEIAKIEGITAPIASGNGVGWPLSDVTEHFLIAFGGPQLQLDLISGKVAWTDPVVEAIFKERLVPLLKAGYFGEPIEWTLALEKWWGGSYALYFMGSWILGMVDDPEDLGLIMLPGTTGVSFVPDYAFVPAYTNYPDKARALLRWLATEGQKIQVTKGGHTPSIVDVPVDLFPPADRALAAKMVGLAAVPDLDDTIGGKFQLTFWDQLKLLWVVPGMVDEVLEALEEVAP